MVKLKTGYRKVHKSDRGNFYYLQNSGRKKYITKDIDKGKLQLQEAQLRYGDKSVMVGIRGGLYYQSILGNEKRYIPSTRRKHVQLYTEDINP
ncbi:MAG: hypothetical protein ACFB0B_07060 [Thermonemataceae bacterium]